MSADTSLSRNLCSGLADLTTAGTAAPRRELNTAASALRDSRVDSGSVDLETPPDASPLGDESRPGKRYYLSIRMNKMNNIYFLNIYNYLF